MPTDPDELSPQQLLRHAKDKAHAVWSNLVLVDDNQLDLEEVLHDSIKDLDRAREYLQRLQESTP